MSDEKVSGVAVWRITEYDLKGNVISDRELKNLIVNSGRTRQFQNLLGLSASGSFVAMAVGASTTAAQVTDTRLTYELIGNPTRKPLTNTSGAALSASDINTATQIIVINASSSATFYQNISVQATYNSGDLNNGNQFGEYALASTAVLPGTPTSTSGVIYNHLIDPNPIQKSAANAINVVCTVWY